MTKISVCCIFYFRNHRSYDLHLWYTCMYKRIISLGIFFFEILIFRIIWRRGVGKRTKNCATWQRIMSVSLRISKTIHHGLWFLVDIQQFFFIFQNFIFGVFQRSKRAKKDLKLPISVCFTLYLRKFRSYH